MENNIPFDKRKYSYLNWNFGSNETCPEFVEVRKRGTMLCSFWSITLHIAVQSILKMLLPKSWQIELFADER